MIVNTRYFRFLAFLLIPFFAYQSCNSPNGEQWRKIDPPDFREISLDMFEDYELDLPFFLANFHHVANAVVEDGDNRGFIDIDVWRHSKDNKPYNARIMESILTLAYFYTSDRPWNVYRGSEEVKVRLEAALEFWCSIQAEDGRFSEYGPKKWNLAATAFATKFMGETLQLLSKGPNIDEKVLRNAVAANRKAIMVVLTNEDLWEFGTSFSNQYSNVWAGALAYLDIYPDAEVEKLFLEKLELSKQAFQSPAGYFYEKDGPDFAYNLGTHENNLMMAYHYTKGTPAGQIFLEKSRRFADWLALNVVPGPNDIFFLNRSVETRRSMAAVELIGPFITQGLALADEVPMLRPYLQTREKCEEIIAAKRASLEGTWPVFGEIEIGEFSAMSPYEFLHRRVAKWFPSEAERQQALDQLPCFSENNFVKTLKDTRKGVSYTFINMPGYYAIFNHGEIISQQQRFGLSLLWSKSSGIVWQSQTKTHDASWGALNDNNEIIESSDLDAKIMVDGGVFQEGTKELNDESNIEIVYVSDQGISKKLHFRPNSIEVEVKGNGTVGEVLPIVLAGEEQMTKDGSRILIDKQKAPVRVETYGATVAINAAEFPLDGFELQTVALTSRNTLKYRVDF